MNDLEITPRKYQDETDLQKFIRIFEPSKFKQLSNGIEIRGVGDMHRATNKASELIKHHSMALTVVNSGEMAAYKAFEVKEIDPKSKWNKNGIDIDEYADKIRDVYKNLLDSGAFANTPAPFDPYAGIAHGDVKLQNQTAEEFERRKHYHTDPFGLKGGASE